MSGRSINFDDKRIKKSDFYKNKKVFNLEDIDVTEILDSKKEPHGKKMDLNTLLGIMIMMLLDYYV